MADLYLKLASLSAETDKLFQELLQTAICVVLLCAPPLAPTAPNHPARIQVTTSTTPVPILRRLRATAATAESYSPNTRTNAVTVMAIKLEMRARRLGLTAVPGAEEMNLHNARIQIISSIPPVPILRPLKT